ncbi:MAG: hypothetical protein HY263_02960 [Chloroflexi bacterium]|nr:hypothetical protein [Chloroflexota bacterium]
MTNPPFRTEVQRLRQWCGDPTIEVEAVVAHLEPIRSRSSLLSSFAREASPSEPVRTAYAIRWLELGSGIAAAGVSRSRRRRVMRPVLRGRS